MTKAFCLGRMEGPGLGCSCGVPQARILKKWGAKLARDGWGQGGDMVLKLYRPLSLPLLFSGAPVYPQL